MNRKHACDVSKIIVIFSYFVLEIRPDSYGKAFEGTALKNKFWIFLFSRTETYSNERRFSETCIMLNITENNIYSHLDDTEANE